MNIILQQFFILVIYAGSVSAESRIFMDVTVGKLAVLPCNWTAVPSTPRSSQSPHVEWRTFSETVFERLGEEQYQGEGYEGRVDVPKNKLVSGDCSLELKDVKPEDAGVYESYLVVKRTKRSLNSKRVFIQSVELSVDDTPEENNIAQDKTNAESRGRSLAFSNSGVISVPSPIITFTILTNILLCII